MKKFILLLLFSIAIYPGTSQAAASRITLLLEHEQSAPWITLLKEGFQRATQDFDIMPETIIAAPGPEQLDIFRQAAASSDLVLVTGESLHELLRDNAGNFRKVMFGCIDAGIRAPNIMCITFADQEAAFLAGAAAALLNEPPGAAGISPGKTLGWLSGMDVPAMRTLYNGFLEGAKFINPQIPIAQQVVGSFTNPEKAAEKAEQLISQNTGIVSLAAGNGNTAAWEVLKKRSILRIDLDMSNTEPGALGAITKAADRAVYEIIRDFVRGNFKGKTIEVYNLENGGVNFTGIENFLNQAGLKGQAKIARRIKELRAEIMRGAIQIRSLRTRTLCDCLD